MATDRILPYGRQVIEDDDVAAVAAALRSDYLTTGPLVDAFESAFAARVGAAHAIACNSGTAALHLAAMGLSLGPGDWLVVPSLTFLATANCARFVGADVQFADVDPNTGLLTEETLHKALDDSTRAGRKVRAVAVVHLSGRTASLPVIARIAAERNIALIEDACHALGTTYDVGGVEARVGDGSNGALAAFSFHPVKTIACGEGGMITTDNSEMARKLRLMRSHGLVRHTVDLPHGAPAGDVWQDSWYYEMHDPAPNYRMPDILCALGISQMAKLDRFVARRRALAHLYDVALTPMAPMVQTVPPVAGCNPALHLYAVLIDFTGLGISRRHVMTELRRRGVGTQVHYIPVHRQPYYRARYGASELPGADAYYERELSLPLYPGMADGDVAHVVAALAEVIRAGRT